jgi:retinol dehydrogenase 14
MIAKDRKVCIVTGGSRGIGRATAHGLAARGAHVILVARDPNRLEETRDTLAAETNAPVDAYQADLSTIAEVKALAGRILSAYSGIDILINNHVHIFPERQVTSDGLEANFALNYLSYYILTRQLLEAVAPSGRIINLAAEVHRNANLDFDDLQIERNYDPRDAYNRAKLAVILFSAELARKVPAYRLTVNSLDPGVVDTDALRAYRAAGTRKSGKPVEPTNIWQGASTVLYLAHSREVSGISGKYFRDNRQIEPSEAAQDLKTARKLWTISANLSRLDDDP